MRGLAADKEIYANRPSQTMSYSDSELLRDPDQLKQKLTSSFIEEVQFTSILL